MTPETLATPDMSRLFNNDNIAISVLSIVVFFMGLYILYKDRDHKKERLEMAASFKDVVKSNNEVAISMAIVSEELRNVRNK